jgi:hypothetical protein
MPDVASQEESLDINQSRQVNEECSLNNSQDIVEMENQFNLDKSEGRGYIYFGEAKHDCSDIEKGSTDFIKPI